jgi:hypothetical protein
MQDQKVYNCFLLQVEVLKVLESKLAVSGGVKRRRLTEEICAASKKTTSQQNGNVNHEL